MGVLQKDSSLQQVTEMALGLTPQEQSLLLGRLYDHLESQGHDAEHDAAWSLEIERRLKEIENGEVELIDHEVVMEELRRQFGQR